MRNDQEKKRWDRQPATQSLLFAHGVGLSRTTIAAALFLSMMPALGCSRGPARIVAPSISASSAGAEAIAMYDANGDGRIGGSELDKSPAMKAALAQIDKDGDKMLTAEEIADRVRTWQDSKLGRVALSCTVFRNGRPLPSAEVRFIPEAFLGENMTIARGKTGPNGTAIISIETTGPSDRSGIAPGLYRVEITQDVEKVPATYNSATILGQEIAMDAPGIRGGIRFDLAY